MKIKAAFVYLTLFVKSLIVVLLYVSFVSRHLPVKEYLAF